MTALAPTAAGRFGPADCRLRDFAALVEQTTDIDRYPHAAQVIERVLAYDASTLRAAITTRAGHDAVEAELIRAFTEGPGVVVFRGAFTDVSVVDRVSTAFDAIIADER